MFHKKVELTELFYDLVFVYAISQMTSLIHHLHEGVVTMGAFLSFLVALLVLVNTWMLQMVYTNRYGKNSFRNIAFMLVSMMMVLALSHTFTTNWAEGTQFYSFILLVAGLTVVPLLQYFWEFFRAKDANNRRFTRFYILMLTARLILLLLSLLFPFSIAATLSFIVILTTTLTPLIFTKLLSEVPINFPHIIERLSLLVIITFGEMLIGIAPYFKPSLFSWNSIWIFLIVANLFMFYIVEIDHLIDEKKKNITGNALIYYHYPIFTGLGMITVSLSFFRDEEVGHNFLLLFLFAGLSLFYAGVLLSSLYNKKEHRLQGKWLIGMIATFVIGFVVTTFYQEKLNSLLVWTSLVTLALTVILIVFNVTRQSHTELEKKF